MTKVTAMACLLSMLLCYKLWLGDRNFPLCPVFTWLKLPAFVSTLLFVAAVALLLCIMFLRQPKKFLIAFAGVAAVLCFLDMNRLQPWFFQYILMMYVISYSDTDHGTANDKAIVMNVLRIMVGAVYFWSGLQKLNPHFPADTYPWLMEPITSHLPPESTARLTWLAYAFPIIETGTGIALFIPRLKKPAIVSVIVMHTFILFSLGPFGHNYNVVVWPWNIAMIIFCIVLFKTGIREDFPGFRMLIRPFEMKIALLFFVLMPLLNFFNLNDSYISHNLYSGNTANGVIYISDSVEARLPEAIKPYSIGEMNQNQITIKYWCMQELGVPAYPEKDNFQAVTNTLYQYASDSSEIYLMFTPKLKLSDL